LPRTYPKPSLTGSKQTSGSAIWLSTGTKTKPRSNYTLGIPNRDAVAFLKKFRFWKQVWQAYY